MRSSGANREQAESALAAERRTFEMIASGVRLSAVLDAFCRSIDAQYPGLASTVEGERAQAALRNAFERLERSESELRVMVDAIPLSIRVLDLDGGTVYANRSLLEYTGLTLRDVLAPGGRSRIFHPEDVERLEDERRRALAGALPFENEQRMLRADGQYRWFLIRFNPVRDPEGRVLRWYATGTDIHDRKQREERVRNENLALREEIDRSSMFEEIVGSSEGLRRVLEQVAKVAGTDSTVLLLGETGTGKELVARAIHKRSRRAAEPFIRVNCAAIPPSLVTSELFGHEKGAFTGALQRRLGRFEAANGGTILLDEIGDLPMETQVALLRVLQEREFERIGQHPPHPSRRARRRGDGPGSRRSGGRRIVPAGTVLSAELVSHPDTAAARAKGRHPSARGDRKPSGEWSASAMRAHGLLVLAVAAGAGLFIDPAGREEATVHQPTAAAASLPVEGDLPSLRGATLWLNSQPLAADGLRGKVVLVEFWTYTCINWRRQLPYVRAWAEKYRDAGLVVIGVHTPEFAFERDVDNVRREAKAMRVDWPIAIDSDRAIWRAFENEYWPALYFVDARGRVRHHQFGEGEYERSEAVLQQLLAEAGRSGFDHAPVSIGARGAEAAADWRDLRSPETYVRARGIERFASTGGAVPERRHAYAAPARLPLNEWALAGVWTLGNDAAVLHEAPGRIAYRFHARDLHLVMGPSGRGTSVRFRVLVDGRPPGAAHGTDVDEQGRGIVTEQRLYQLIRQPAPIADRQFEIEFLDPGVEVFVFTFG